MAIHLKCPNGHKLTAKESNAGKTGKCPVCKSPIVIPKVKQETLSESAILDILGDPEPRTPQPGTLPLPSVATATPKAAVFGRPVVSTTMLPTTKSCPTCDRDIDVGYHICPHCHTYLTGLSDF